MLALFISNDITSDRITKDTVIHIIKKKIAAGGSWTKAWETSGIC